MNHIKLNHVFRKIPRFHIKIAKIFSYGAMILCPIITFFLFECYTHNPMETMTQDIRILNVIFYEIFALFLLAVFRSCRVALMFQSTFFMLVGLVNYYVLCFRSAPIRPWDLYSLQTAVNVADNYDYALESKTICIIVGFVLLIVVESFVHIKLKKGILARAGLGLLTCFMFCGYVNKVQDDEFVQKVRLYDKFFTPFAMCKKDGNVVAFLMGMEYMTIDKPEGYSRKNIETMFQTLEGESISQKEVISESQAMKRPNILVIMDEAFSDLSVLGELETNQEVMPFMRSLQSGKKNTITGQLHVSVLGGNTANTEFEFLTGCSMAFLPQGSVAYQQYVRETIPSMASHLADLGYHTIAMHPYYPSGWDRSKVYDRMGFDQFLSKKNFSNVELIRKYISDETCFEKMIDLYEKKGEEPLFIFNVTMQNHGGYNDSYANFVADITANQIESTSLLTYLSLLKRTDEALQELIYYFEHEEEDTMIVFFGDHQPASYVSNPILRANGINPSELGEDENLLRYQVPYVIWSNFDIKEMSNQETSANYLMMDVLQQCGLPLPLFQEKLAETRNLYPVVTAMQTKKKNGERVVEHEKEKGLDLYKQLQYYVLFD